MVQSIPDPHPKRRLGEEHILLAEGVQLGVAVQYARRHELVKDADDQWGEDGKDDIVKRNGPGFIGDLA